MRIPQTPPDFSQILDKGNQEDWEELFRAQTNPSVREFVQIANDEYLHWNKLRHRQMPEGFSAETVWAVVAMSRYTQFQTLPISFSQTGMLRYWIPPQQQEWLSQIDQQAGGFLGSWSPRGIPEDNDRYLFNSLMEEAIASSQLEGACTTREIAKEMLRTNRRPVNKAEQMILNNYKAILEIRDLRNEKLTPSLICHLQEVLTADTLDKADAAGRLRRSDEDINVVDSRTGEVLHHPPAADELPRRLEEICALANAKAPPFVHPVVKAMTLHFSIGFVHPFVDGNGRTGRALFYWYMLKNNYWLFEYLPISRLLVKAPSQYSRSFLYTETDRGDLTYFNHYNLKVVNRAIRDLHDYLEGQRRALTEAEAVLQSLPYQLNHRQQALIYDALKHPREQYTARAYEGKFRVAYNTARNDLNSLEKAGLLVKRKDKSTGEWTYFPAPDLLKQLHMSSRPADAADAQASTTLPPVAVTAALEDDRDSEAKQQPEVRSHYPKSTLFE